MESYETFLQRKEELAAQEPYEEDSEEEEDDDDDWYWEDGTDITKHYTATRGSNPQVSRLTLSDSVMNKITEKSRQKESAQYRVKDKSDRATVEQVLDPRTRMILFKMLTRGVISEINGCISTGKEANVYHASTSDGGSRAIKIYKTSILMFKDRDKYVSGEFRFRHGYCKGNPRKMVKTWAEKEMRNLIRLNTAGIPCPEPIMLRSHVLLMGFIGKNDMNVA
ncbi:hypothetical protein GDO78_018656 [Eleutherodactylus coqui]|uniref:Serine/threonine-protein kinase RIO1 n=1 Tax=Eleutherodactylus coqui TaxID=57060 RepID=A0A8J6B6Y8_ELECQ|nr:hypothetical protein GDO78_018656 [Eleutherodactylus coqui]